MKIELSSANPLHYSTPALVIGCFQDDENEIFTGCNSAVDG